MSGRAFAPRPRQEWAGCRTIRDDYPVPDEDVVARIHALQPKNVADDVLRATADLGGEAQRFEIMDRALDIGGWSFEELDVPAWWQQAARSKHLRALVDSAVDLCGQRGLLEKAGVKGRWRLPGAVAASGVGSEYRPATRPAGDGRQPIIVEIDLNDLDARTDEHMALQDRLSEALEARGITPLSWRSPEPLYDLVFELDEDIVVVEVKTLGVRSAAQQMRLGAGQLLEYRQRLTSLYGRPVRAVLLTSALPGEPWPDALASSAIALMSGDDLDGQLDAVLDRLRAG
jgi:hypothetical protein